MDTQGRGSHFVLGHMKDNPVSIYAKDYPPKQAEFDGKGLGQNPFRGSSLGSGKNDPNQFLTTNRIKYQQWKNVEKAQLDAKKAHDLKTHHFSLGNYNNKSQTTTNQYYHNQKELSGEAGKTSEQQKNRMRAHNHDFKETGGNLMSSVYNKEYTKKESAPAELSSNAQGVRQTHIIFGKDRHYMETTSGLDYTKKDGGRTATAQIQTANLVLGCNKDSFETTNQIYHGEKQLQRNDLPTETLKELRQTHFRLGGTDGGYQTESNNYRHFKGHQPDKAFNPKLQNSSPIAPDGRFYGQTTNQKELPPRSLTNNTNSKPEMQGNNFALGNQGNSYLTEAASRYTGKAGGPAESAKKANVGEGIVIGSDRNDFVTTHRANYTTKDLNQARPDKLGDNKRGSHFTIGNTNEQHITVYQDQYRDDQDKKSSMFHKVRI